MTVTYTATVRDIGDGVVRSRYTAPELDKVLAWSKGWRSAAHHYSHRLIIDVREDSTGRLVTAA